MRLILAILLWSLRAAFRSRADLVLENLALRQQVATFGRAKTRPMLKPDERAFWVALSRASSREQAASTLRGHDLNVVAKSIARIFLQNAINLGLNLVICPTIEAKEGDELELEPGKVVNKTTGKQFATVPLPPARQAIIDAGGLIAYTRKRLMQQPAR